MNVMKPIYELTNEDTKPHMRLAVAFWVGGGVCVFSLLCGVCLGYLDLRASRILPRTGGRTGDLIQLKHIKQFPLALWLLFIICVTYVAVVPFIGLAIVFFENKYGLSSQEANAANSLVYFISAGASPFIGLLVDRFGRNIFWVIFGVLCTLLSHILLAFTFCSPFMAMSLMGCSFSILVCALWPIVAFIMPQHQLGTAYGCMQSIFNLGLAVTMQISGIIVDIYGFFILEVFFMSCLCVALASSVLLYLVDASHGGFLNLSTYHRGKKKGKVDLGKSQG